MFGRGMRTREQRVLQHPARRRIDEDRDLIDRRRRRMRFEIEQRQRAQRADVAQRCGQLQMPLVQLTRDQPQRDVQRRRPAIARFETRRQRFEQTREHERQRFEPFDRPLEIERRVEPLLRERRHERPDVVAARDRLPEESLRSEARGEVGRRQRGELAKRLHTPTLKRRDR